MWRFDLDRIGYVLACLVVPLAWGLLMAAVSRRIDGRAQAKIDPRALPPIDYSI
jgi:hypothetical protein